MGEKIYLRPLGILSGTGAMDAVHAGEAIWLAGGPFAFTLVEIIEGSPQNFSETLLPAKSLKASKDSELRDRVERLCASRAAIAGLPMDRVHLMGIVNVTPDSFSDGGQYSEKQQAVHQALKLEMEGATILDIGGESTRPDAEFVPLQIERERVIPVLEELREKTNCCLSVDTRKSVLMRDAADAGADLINDVSALTFDPDSLKVVNSTGLPVVLMHALADPKTMQDNPKYENVLLEVYDFLEARIDAATAAGIPRASIIADPGIGFGKTLDHNLELLRGIGLFHSLGVPILLGASRKRFIGALANEPNPLAREPGSLAAALAGASQGVQLLRVHDVAGMRQALTVWQASTN